jgi:hypothetical protein
MNVFIDLVKRLLPSQSKNHLAPSVASRVLIDNSETTTSPLDIFMKSIDAEPWPTKGSDFEHDTEVMLAYAYRMFGFPDGSRSPKGMLMGPGLDHMKESLLKVIDPMLKPKEKFLLSIPIEFARVPHIDATHLFDQKSDKRYIILNMKLFSSLYAVNERFHELYAADQGKTELIGDLLQPDDMLTVALKFPDRISRFFLGYPSSVDTFAFRLVTKLNEEIGILVWAHTTIQQVYLVLHEMGHAYLGHGKSSGVAIGQSVSAWQSDNSKQKQEEDADRFAARHMSQGPWPEELPGRFASFFGLFQLFESLELLRKMNRYSNGSHMLPRRRFSSIALEIDRGIYAQHKLTFEHYQSLLDDVYLAWKLNSTEEEKLG